MALTFSSVVGYNLKLLLLPLPVAEGRRLPHVCHMARGVCTHLHDLHGWVAPMQCLHDGPGALPFLSQYWKAIPPHSQEAPSCFQGTYPWAAVLYIFVWEYIPLKARCLTSKWTSIGLNSFSDCFHSLQQAVVPTHPPTHPPVVALHSLKSIGEGVFNTHVVLSYLLQEAGGIWSLINGCGERPKAQGLHPSTFFV